MQVLSDFTPSDAVNGPVSARNCCMRATNFFTESLSSDFVPHAVTFFPVPYQKQLLRAVHLAAQTFAWTTFPERDRLGLS